MHDKDDINSLWGAFITVSGIAGIINIIKAFKRPTWDEMDKKDIQVYILKKRIKHYQDIINGTIKRDELG